MYVVTSNKLQDLRSLLAEKGFRVRQHCCEYFLIRNNQFVGVLSLFPNWNQVLFTSTKTPEAEKSTTEILESVKEIFPKLKVELQVTENPKTRTNSKITEKLDESSPISVEGTIRLGRKRKSGA
ncbi:MAG: hypothetical protein WED07_05755 [Candidatus Freyarchaeum deiterrae]